MSVELWHVSSPEKALKVMDSGFILLAHREQEPRDRVFAYDKETALYVSKYGNPKDVWITFEVPEVAVWVGDLSLENTPEYPDSYMPYLKYKHMRKYEEAEMMVSYPVKPKYYYDRRTFKPLSRKEIEERL